MEHSLKPNKSYSLSREEDANKSKEFYFMKLTDSSIRAVEEFLQHKGSIKGYPKVQFFGQNGVICIPSNSRSGVQDVGKRFKFSCSYFARDSRQGITECIHQATQTQTMLTTMGMIEKKIAVLGTDEAYEVTKNRMAQADQERKEIRTKEIKIHHSKSKKKKPSMISKKESIINKKSIMSLVKPTNGIKTSTATNISTSRGISYKDRVIHILALRPHKKPEIVARLQREGISSKEKISLGTILQQVATMQDNSFKLNKHHYLDLKPDTWPYYSDKEKSLVKEFQHRTHSQESSPKVSSTSTSPEGKATKRVSNEDYNHTPLKKKRIAKPIQDPSTSSSVLQHVKNATNSEQSKPDTTGSKFSARTESMPKHPKEDKKLVSSLQKSFVKSKENEKVRPDDMTEASSPTVASSSDIPDHILKYKPIESYEQRCKYKQDFQTQYKEYIELKKIVDSVSRKFLELDQSRKKYPEDSEKGQKIRQEIYRQYDKHQKDKKYKEMKQRYGELYVRLSHIKKLVVEYDQNHLQSVS